MSKLKPLTKEELDRDIKQQAEVTHAVNGGAETARLAREFRADGHRSQLGGDGRSSGGPSDPTASAVLARNGARDDSELSADRDVWYGPELTESFEAMWTAAWRQYQDAARRLLQVRTTIHSHADHQDRVTSSRIPFCVNKWCGDDLILDDGEVPRRGRCRPCNGYLDRHDRDAPPNVIRDRRRKRGERAETSPASSPH